MGVFFCQRIVNSKLQEARQFWERKKFIETPSQYRICFKFKKRKQANKLERENFCETETTGPQRSIIRYTSDIVVYKDNLHGILYRAKSKFFSIQDTHRSLVVVVVVVMVDFMYFYFKNISKRKKTHKKETEKTHIDIFVVRWTETLTRTIC